MIANPNAEGMGQALARLASCLGLHWAIFWAEQERWQGSMPEALPACAKGRRCAVLEAEAACPGARAAELGVSEPFRLIVCQGKPSLPPSSELVTALAEALAREWRVNEEVEATVRELTATYQELAIAYGVMETISLPVSIKVMAEGLLGHVVAATGAEGCCLLQFEGHEGVRPLAVQDMSAEEIRAIWQSIAQKEQARLSGDQPYVLGVGERQLLVSSLQREAHWCGLVAIARDNRRPFTTREAKLLQAVGRQAALALRERKLVEDLQSMFLHAIQALVTAIELKDAYTCGHSRRVAESARNTGRIMGLSEEELQALYLASIVHDIGKLAIDQRILCKPEALTEEEWQAIRSHAEYGAGIINCIPQLQHLVDGIRHHHERVDGTGYPYGLKGEQIPLFSRIISVCDSYDAMTSHRAYRPALGEEEAVRELKACAGRQFFAPAVEAFVATLHEYGEEGI